MKGFCAIIKKENKEEFAREVKMLLIKEETHPEQKAQIVASILRDLPEWFGIEVATQWYIENAKTSQCLVAYDANQPLGFITLAPSSSDCLEIVCMGVKRDFYRQKIGSSLIKEAEDSFMDAYSLLQVKTVDQGHYPEYDKTNLFYQQCGFKKLEVFPDLWDKHNPCLVWVKEIGKIAS